MVISLGRVQQTFEKGWPFGGLFMYMCTAGFTFPPEGQISPSGKADDSEAPRFVSAQVAVCPILGQAPAPLPLVQSWSSLKLKELKLQGSSTRADRRLLELAWMHFWVFLFWMT